MIGHLLPGNGEEKIIFAQKHGFPMISDVGENTIQQLIFSSENENTSKSTFFWLSVFHKWAEARNIEVNIEVYDCPKLTSITLNVGGDNSTQTSSSQSNSKLPFHATDALGF